MIAPNEWWAVIQGYNLAIIPAQIMLYLLAVVVAGFFIWKPGEIASRLAKGFFALAFGWIGLVFFLMLGQKLPAHNAQAFLFLSLTALFTVELLANTSPFRMPDGGWRRTATLFGFGLALAYPLVGLLASRPPSGWIIPGAFPCPTTALALVFMAAAWCFPGGGFDNAEFFGPHVQFAPALSQDQQLLLFDPQTSGGLLFAVAPDRAGQCEQDAVERKIPLWRVAEVTSTSTIEVT